MQQKLIYINLSIPIIILLIVILIFTSIGNLLNFNEEVIASSRMFVIQIILPLSFIVSTIINLLLDRSINKKINQGKKYTCFFTCFIFLPMTVFGFIYILITEGYISFLNLN